MSRRFEVVRGKNTFIRKKWKKSKERRRAQINKQYQL